MADYKQVNGFDLRIAPKKGDVKNRPRCQHVIENKQQEKWRVFRLPRYY
jgi:hypothetical protein